MSQQIEPTSPATSSHSAPNLLPSTTSLFPSRSPFIHHLPQLKTALQKVATSRGNVYTKQTALLVNWENDNTGAAEDVKTMQKITEAFGMEPEHYVVKNSDSAPGWTLSHRIHDLLQQGHDMKTKSLFVFYYAGHGTVINDTLSFVSNRKLMLWPEIRSAFTSHHYDFMKQVDVLVILDCCHAAYGTRDQVASTIQVIAACGASETASPRGQKVSFTMRLFRAVQHFRDQSNVTTAALFQELQRLKPRNAPNAVMETLSGAQPIKLIFKNPASPSRIPRPTSHTKDIHVLVKLTVHAKPGQTPGHSELWGNFQNAIRDLPPNMQVEVKDAYETDQSVFFVMGMSWEAWSLWTMVTHLDFIGTTIGPSLMNCPKE